MKWITRLTIVAVFVLGAVSGVMIGMKLEREKFLNLQRKSPSTLTERALDRISGEIKLAPGQRERLRSLLNEVQPLLAAVEKERRTKIIAVMETVRLGALVFLDAAQKDRYEKLHTRMKERLGSAAEATSTATLPGLW
ncbi:MAG TPA: hypothetical protein VHM91_00995 [Verrucomicrobiales bacterium]|jgi:hypothetical protein|nr:hypothetical protein [Verrucomicrobiales bacterium]